MVRRSAVACIVLPLLAFVAVPILAAPPAAAGGFCHEPAIDGTTVAVDAKGNCFSPSVVHVRAGADVTFKNRDDLEHTVTGQGGVWGGNLPGGQTLMVRFDRPGVFPYFCLIHIGMIGAVVVSDGAAPVLGAQIASTASTSVPVAAAAANALSRGAPAGPAVPPSTHRGRRNGRVLLAAAGVAVLLALAAGTRRHRHPTAA